MAKKKTITFSCDFKETNSKLTDCLEAIDTYGLVDINEVDAYNLSKLVKTAEQFLEIYEEESSVADIEENEDSDNEEL